MYMEYYMNSHANHMRMAVAQVVWGDWIELAPGTTMRRSLRKIRPDLPALKGGRIHSDRGASGSPNDLSGPDVET